MTTHTTPVSVGAMWIYVITVLFAVLVLLLVVR
jgi:hypothetical protein